MPEKSIQVFFEDADNEGFTIKNNINWLITRLISLGQKAFSINYIFCSDEYLLKVNQEYLNHNYYTDIITFNNSENEDFLESDIFISLDRVRENSKENKVSFENELARVMIHGVLHLVGFNDKTDEEQKMMTHMENKHLALHPNLNP